MDGPYPVKVVLAWWHSTCTVQRLKLPSWCCGTLVRLSTQFCSDLNRTASTDSPYSLTRLASASSCHLISISLAALAFPYDPFVHTCRVSGKCNIVASHISAMFTPSTVSSSAKFMCYISLSFHNQLASSTAAPSCSSDTPVARELASTQTTNSGQSTHHFPCTGSSWQTLVTTSVIIVVNRTSVTLSSQTFVMSAALLLMNAAATLSHSTTAKCLTSFPQNENMAHLRPRSLVPISACYPLPELLSQAFVHCSAATPVLCLSVQS